LDKRPQTISAALFQGLYPRIYWQDLDAQEWISGYVQTYLQKDVRQLINLDNLTTFDRFLRLLAGRVGQVLNYSSLANDVGTSVPTIKNWISILEASYVVFLLTPHHKNFNKRIIKSPKLYFYDTGIVSFLLRIHSPAILDDHPLRGFLFENWVVSEKIKKFIHRGLPSPYYYWRDQHGHEVDLVEDRGTTLFLTEIKSAETFHSDFTENLAWLNSLQRKESGEVIYGGNDEFKFKTINVVSWKNI
jgi:predicted AAA+ superfamily ATPase